MHKQSFAELKHTNPTYTYVTAFIDELLRAGLQHIVICPGSRSTPLALVCAAHPLLRTWMHVDERSAAFFALGMAKRLQAPVALLCTSGTAAANFLPALVEARLTHIPLLVLTADRPHELRDCGAPQAIDQNRLYGTHTKWFAEMALPEATTSALRYVRTIAGRALSIAKDVPAGPVHLNFPLREPLIPDGTIPEPPATSIPWHGRADNHPYIQVETLKMAAPAATTITTIANALASRSRGLIIAGPQDEPHLTEPLLKLAAQLHYPLLADPLSQLRHGPHVHTHIVTSYDAFLRNTSFTETMRPEIILRFGTMPTSKPLLLYLKRYADCPQLIIDSQGDWQEPTQLASELIHTDPVAFCNGLIEQLDTLQITAGRSDWLQQWQQSNTTTCTTLQTTISDFTTPFEGRIFRELDELLPAGATLFAGNSMPVRDMDTFLWGSSRPIRVQGNRGANGIDGIISTALGISAVTSQQEPVVLVIGDLSFYHDLNGLLAARLHGLNLTIVLVNNDGGGIFSFLPQAAYPAHFEQLFGTPTGLDFRPVVEMYGGKFQRISDWNQFRASIRHSLTDNGLHVLEVVTERTANVHMHRQLWQAVDTALQPGKASYDD